MKIGLFFGSFNPIHTGHLIIANFMATHTDLDKVWMVVSPQNPLKEKKTLARDHDRLHLVRLAEEKQKPNEQRLREYGEASMDSLRTELFSTAPIYEELARSYKGQANFFTVDVEKETGIDRDYGVIEIPNILFFSDVERSLIM